MDDKEQIRHYLYYVALRAGVLVFMPGLWALDFLNPFLLVSILIDAVLLNAVLVYGCIRRRYLTWLPYFIVVGDFSVACAFVYTFGATSLAITFFYFIICGGSLLGEHRWRWITFGLGCLSYSVMFWLEFAGVLRFSSWHQGNVWLAAAFWGFVIACFFQLSQLVGYFVSRHRRFISFLERFLPHSFIQDLRDTGRTAAIGHVRKKLTIFFSDIEGFTSASDALEPEDLAKVLNEYQTEMANAAHLQGGTIDKFMGDGLLVFFGDPVFESDRVHALRALAMAVDMRNRFESLKQRWHRQGINIGIGLRMGVNTGMVAVGIFGSEKQMNYSILGKQANLAQRIQSHAANGQILISETTFLLLRDEIESERLEETSVRGISRPVVIYVFGGFKSSRASEPSAQHAS